MSTAARSRWQWPRPRIQPPPCWRSPPSPDSRAAASTRSFPSRRPRWRGGQRRTPSRRLGGVARAVGVACRRSLTRSGRTRWRAVGAAIRVEIGVDEARPVLPGRTTSQCTDQAIRPAGQLDNGRDDERAVPRVDGGQARGDRKLAAILAATDEIAPEPHGSRVRRREEGRPMAEVGLPARLRDEDLDGAAEQISNGPSEHARGALVREDDSTVAVDDDDGIWAGLEESFGLERQVRLDLMGFGAPLAQERRQAPAIDDLDEPGAGSNDLFVPQNRERAGDRLAG